MASDFPELIPSSRSIDAGDYPIKSFKAQNGTELRILYGNRRTGMKIDLQYQGIPDTEAELFYDHYHQQKGTFGTFGLPPDYVKQGWEGNEDVFGGFVWGNTWRYAGPPIITNLYPGVSNVAVSLVAVLN